MENEKTSDLTIFFWLNLEERLDPMFYSVSELLHTHGVQLLPVKMEQVSRLVSLTDTAHVLLLCSTRRQAEYAAFMKQVAPTLGFLLKQERLSLFHFSSFHKLDIAPTMNRQQNYFFFKYPLNLTQVCAKLKQFHQVKVSQAKRWPGGKRPGATA